MAFTVTFYTFSKKENSTATPSQSSGTSFNCKLLSPSGVLSPTLEINLGVNNYPNYNYAYIPNFNRYYWISDWVNDGPLWRCSLNVDVLASYKTSIGDTNLYVLRAANSYDGDIIDTLYPTDTDATIISTEYPSIYGESDNFISNGMFIIGVVGTAATYGSVEYYCVPPIYMRYICEKLLDNNFLSTGADGLSLNDATITLQKSLIDPLSYIKSAIYLPFNIQGSGGTPQTYINIWSWTIDNIVVSKLGKEDLAIETSVSMAIPKHPQTAARGNFVNVAPYTQLEISIPPFNMINVDTVVSQAGGSISCNIRVDKPTGVGVLECYIGTTMIARESAQVGVPIQLSQVTHDYLGAVKQVNSIMGGFGDMAMGRISGSGIANIMNAGIGTIESLYRPIQSSTGHSGALSLFVYNPKLFAKFQNIVDDDINCNGRPLCKVIKPNTIGGYMLIQDADISLPATEQEITRVREYLEGGFYYE